MAAEDYIDKLPILYQEFDESERFNRGKPSAHPLFTSALDLMQKTPSFWTKYVQPKIRDDFQGLYRFLAGADSGGGNEYIERIEANMERLKLRLAEQS
jgi:hypothetical protein